MDEGRRRISVFKIKYNKARFPIQQKRANGKPGCRGCGGAIPKGRRSWCSQKCVSRFNPATVILEVKKRDREVCDQCGYDYRAARAEWIKQCHNAGLSLRSYATRKIFPAPTKIEYDHIIPFSEGGLTVLENMRSLCTPCHKERTRLWHQERRNPGEQEPPLASVKGGDR